MSLLYDADGDAFDSTTDIAVPETGTAITWFFPTSDTARQTVATYDGDGLGSSYLEMVWRADVAGDNFEMYRQRATTDVQVAAAAANYAAYGLNKWICRVDQWDASASVNADQRILIGDLTTPPAGPSAYATQLAGSGAAGTVAGSVRVGNAPVSVTRWLRGRVGFHAIFSGLLSPANVNAIWAGTYQNSPLVWWLPGANGVIDVPDSVAGNLGIITALSSADLEPARYFVAPGPPLRGMVTGGARLR